MTAMTAIYDTMQYIKPDVQTVCLGQAASAAAILLASGTKGKRLMLPNARVLIHQPAIDQGFGKATEIEIQAKEMLRMREWLEETLAKHTGQDVEKIRRDIEVDTFLTAPEAKEYGIVDEVLEHRQLNLPDIPMSSSPTTSVLRMDMVVQSGRSDSAADQRNDGGVVAPPEHVQYLQTEHQYKKTNDLTVQYPCRLSK